MPKIEIDYSNTIIYQITCKNPDISDLYVGHTTNFVQRKHSHKQGCINEKNSNYKCKLYEVIRNNGGWENWKMEIINSFECKNHYEAIQKEQEYFLSLNATLNSIEHYAILKPKDPPIIENTIIKEILYCKECNKHFNSKDLLNTHNQTNKHIKKIKYQSCENIIISKKHNVFNCEKCKFSCIRKPDWARHLDTSKHNKLMLVNTELIEKTPKIYSCHLCNKEYHSNVGLWKHKKKCVVLPNESSETIVIDNTDKDNNVVELLINENKDFKNMIMELVKSNTDLQKQMIDVCKQIQPGTINNNTNSHNNNKTFNLQFFLNEQCKDAMNMSDFINSIQLKLSDLENVGKLGYTEGMSNILINHLNGTEMYKRPIHCSDAKRETLYIKEENKWEKEGPENAKMKYAVRIVEKKNLGLLSQWQVGHPKYLDSDSSQSEEYMKLINTLTSGNAEMMNKVIKRVTKEVVIEK